MLAYVNHFHLLGIGTASAGIIILSMHLGAYM